MLTSEIFDGVSDNPLTDIIVVFTFYKFQCDGEKVPVLLYSNIALSAFGLQSNTVSLSLLRSVLKLCKLSHFQSKTALADFV